MLIDYKPPKRYRRSRVTSRKRISILGLVLSVIVVALVFMHQTPGTDTEASVTPPAQNSVQEEPVQEMDTPTRPAPVREAQPVVQEPQPVVEYADGCIKSGDTAAGLLGSLLTPEEIHAMSVACAKVFSLTRIRAGQDFRIGTLDGAFNTFEYEIDSDQKLIVSRSEDGFIAVKQDIAYDLETVLVSGTITDNLFNSVHRAGEQPELAMILADIFAWDVDFCRDIRQGDSFKILVEKRYRGGSFAGYGSTYAAEFTNKGETYQGFRYEAQEGRPSYYDAQGKSLRKIFLKAPLSFRRISSGYSFKRLHPILKYNRPHLGIDYAASTGTPVWTVGDGTVIAKGYNKAAGYYVRMRHNSIYETQYNHLSKYPRGMKKGKFYKQGQVIGYVGSTGYSTGPHLDFRMYKYGKNINPLRVKFPSADPIPEKLMAEFTSHIQPLMAKLDGTEPTAVAGLASR